MYLPFKSWTMLTCRPKIMYSSSQVCVLITLEMHHFMLPVKAQDRKLAVAYNVKSVK